MGGVCSTESTDESAMRERTPHWVYAVRLDQSTAADTFGRMSDGFQIVSQNSVERHRAGHFETDGAQWSRGFTKGKHIFEIIFPDKMRHTAACVGVGTKNASLNAKGRVSLVGSNVHSWGIDLRTKRAFHRGKLVKKYPVTQIPIPDKFYMYLDCDARKLLFGTENKFYGTACDELTTDEELFPMVSACVAGATIVMIYRGEGVAGAPPAPVVYGMPALPPQQKY